MMLAAVQTLFGLALLSQKLLVTVLYVASGLLLMRRARRIFPHPWGEPIAWVAITLVPVLEFGHYVMSEIPYLFFSLLALEAYEKTPSGRPRFVILTALFAAATFYTRSVGLALWAGLALAMLFQRGFPRRGLLLFFAASFLLILPWGLRVLFGPENPYFRQLIQVNPFFPEWGFLSFGGWMTRIATNVRVYVTGEIPMQLLPVVFRWTYDPARLRYAFLPWFIIWIPLLLLVVGLGRALARRGPVGFYILFYLILNLIWPRIWTGLRFLVPILPILMHLAFEGLLYLLGVLRGRFPKRAWIATLLLSVWVGLGVWNQLTLSQRTGTYPSDWDAYFRAAAFIKEKAPADALIVDRKAAMLAYATDRKVVNFPRVEPEEMITWMDREGVDLVLVSALPYDDIMRWLQPAVIAHQHRFEPVFEIEEPYTVLLRLRRASSSPAP